MNRLLHISCVSLLAAGALVLSANQVWGQDQRVWDPQARQWVAAPEPKEGTPAGELAIIRQAMDNDEPKQAVNAAEKFLDRYATDPLRERVFLLAGRAQMERGKYLDAHQLFERQIAEFPGGVDFEQALSRIYDIGNAFVSGRKTKFMYIIPIGAEDKGLEILQGIAVHSPGSEITQKALMRIGDYHYAEGNWARAVDAYDNYVRLFSKTDGAAQAQLNAARATFSQFVSVQHDDKPLLEAQQRFKAFAAAWPDRAEQSNVSGVLSQIADARSEKLFRIGEFYQRTARPKAAAYYYRLVGKDFPESRWANQAQKKLASLPQSESSEKPQTKAQQESP